jgi:ankyrin repeat protein
MMDLMHIAIIEFFLTIDIMERTPLYCAVWNNHINAVELLIRHGANVNDDNGTLLHVASEYGCVGCIRLLLEGGADPNIGRLLHRIVYDSRMGERAYDIAKLLIQYGASVNHKDYDCCLPIYLASEVYDIKMIVLLLDHGALYTDIKDSRRTYKDIVEKGVIKQNLSALEIRFRFNKPTIQALIYMVREHCRDPSNRDMLIKRLEVAFNL